jgi:hypothetical protein
MESAFTIREIPSWAQPFITYLANNELPEDEILARQIQHRAKAYMIINKELYKHSVSGIYQHCVDPAEGLQLL